MVSVLEVKTYLHVICGDQGGVVLGECRTLWGEREQAACILATKESMRYQKLLEVTILVGSLRWHIVGSLVGPIAYTIMSA